jgi:hypothetical protein
MQLANLASLLDARSKFSQPTRSASSLNSPGLRYSSLQLAIPAPFCSAFLHLQILTESGKGKKTDPALDLSMQARVSKAIIIVTHELASFRSQSVRKLFSQRADRAHQAHRSELQTSAIIGFVSRVREEFCNHPSCRGHNRDV